MIPLLHNPTLLKARIEETFSVIQHGIKRDIGADMTRSQHLQPPTQSEIEHIRQEVTKIDPIYADRVMPIILQSLKGSDIQLCLDNPSAIASRYNIAKKQFETERPVCPAPSSPGITGQDLIDEADTVSAFQRLDLGTSSINDLLNLSSRNVLSNLQGAEGDALLSKLGIDRPTSEDRSWVKSWTRQTMAMRGLERKLEISAVLAKRLDVSRAVAV